MSYHEFILAINFSCIIILLLLAALLLAATRFRGENGYAAAIIVLPNVSVYIYTMSRMLGWYETFLFPDSLFGQYDADALVVAFYQTEL